MSKHTPPFIPENYESPKCPIMDRYEQEERGNRSNYVRVNITMSPSMLSILKRDAAELQELGYSDTDVSSLVRRACAEFSSQIADNLYDVRNSKKSS